ncbi:MAG: cytochrome ubiquinol oxidase subunit II [Firmicutes bacterium]|uniref:Cytochrome ubiquinol oxidase subunit II n=1 Tax=Sulfobacillus benefaciens TaxID=453960 RepID=A0A2T2WTQ2_9FIRM|nr:cytochrome ubiquinol oxidase subunit II [Bacillota bacterium]MCL5014190.1 cytochrome ubiquinol oxidase subunit II [Bacillota bacterium]PSR25628.1 MAG: cytochrome ubiquinol oxidase subunit II [Sulfobacillus benefaciens]
MPKRQSTRWPYRWIPLAVIVSSLLSGCGQHYTILHPAGPVGQTELNLLVLASIAMAIVIIPVWILLAVVLVRFRDNPRHKGTYIPKWQRSKFFEVMLFVVPLIIVAVIAVPTVQKTYALDTLPRQKDPLIIHVTSLDWKWMFQYPVQHIATVNYIKIPAGVPVLFKLTADSPMNTFWVPQLGGMEYTMPGEVLPLWLEANKPGVYMGRSGQFSGRGFVHMVFKVDAVPRTAFNQWVHQVKTTAPSMSVAKYHALAHFGYAGAESFSSYPAGTFPTTSHGFTLTGSSPMVMP